MESLISVVIPVFNREKTIKRAIESVLSQTYKNLEVIVVDDCSRDNTKKEIDTIDDKRLKVISLPKNHGACYARNVGIDNSKGEYITFQDSDDVWDENKIAEQLFIIKKSRKDMVFCGFNRISNGKKKERIPKKGFMMPESKKELVKLLLKDNVISTQTIMVKKKVFEEIKFDETLPRFQDWDLVIRIAEKHTIVYLPKALVDVYIQNDSITKNPEKGYIALQIMTKKYKKYIELDEDIRNSFLKKECILGYKSGRNMTGKAKEFLRRKKDIKVLAVLFLSYFRTNR